MMNDFLANMNATNTTVQDFLKRTCWAYVSTRVLDTPFWAIYNMLPIILYKDLHASPLQLAAIIALKPLSSIFSMYWSASINNRRDRLVSNIIWARILSYIPFFFYPFVDNPWFFIASFGFYMMLTVGIVPAWMEILKLTIPSVTRERVFSYTQVFGYMGGGLLPFVLGWMLDGYFQAWRWIFPLAAFLSLSALIFQTRMLVPSDQEEPSLHSNKMNLGLWSHLITPWKNAWGLICKRPDFAKFQIGFMWLGSGLMIIQPALPVFFVDVLNLSYTELAIAITLCKGIGFAIASPLWTKMINRMDIYRLSGYLSGLACLLPICLIFAEYQLGWLYLGYLSYGIMQAGNELMWNMSGPIFAKNEDSSLYSSINVLAVGLRGCVIPALGSLFCSLTNSPFVMVLGGTLCFIAMLRQAFYSKKTEFSLQNAD